MKYDPDIHHRQSVRLNGYFITITTEGLRCLFGQIVDGKMVLNNIGRIVEDEWKRTGEIRKEVVLDESVVMPNHVHGILFIVDRPYHRTGTVPVRFNGHPSLLRSPIPASNYSFIPDNPTEYLLQKVFEVSRNLINP